MSEHLPYSRRRFLAKTLDEVIAAKPNAAYDAKWGPATEFLAYVYQGV